MTYLMSSNGRDKVSPPPRDRVSVTLVRRAVVALATGLLAASLGAAAPSPAWAELSSQYEGFESGLSATDKITGDVKVIDKLGSSKTPDAIKPHAGGKMLYASTGPAAVGNQKSTITRPLTVPIDVTSASVSFYWNLVSAEWPNFPAQGYLDRFDVHLLKADGGRLLIRTIDINDLPMQRVDVDLPGGDKSVGQTGWQSVVIQLSSEQLTDVTGVSVEVTDVQDSALTSALLLDHVTVVVDRARFRAEGCHFKPGTVRYANEGDDAQLKDLIDTAAARWNNSPAGAHVKLVKAPAAKPLPATLLDIRPIAELGVEIAVTTRPVKTGPISKRLGETGSDACSDVPGKVYSNIAWVNINSAYAGTKKIPAFDQQTDEQKLTTIVHEFGHALGLDHYTAGQTDCANMQVMQPFMDDLWACGIAAPRSGDVAGIERLYGK